MKSLATTKTVSRKPVQRRVASSVRSVSKKRQDPSAVSLFQKSTARYGKRAVRSMLLSKAFHTTFKIGIITLIVGSALYGTYAFIGNNLDDKVVVSKTEIVARVRAHTTLPETEPEAVVRVENADTLKQQNPFYENIKEGDYIIIYPMLAVIYDLRKDTIVALKRKDR